MGYANVDASFPQTDELATATAYRLRLTGSFQKYLLFALDDRSSSRFGGMLMDGWIWLTA